MCPGHRSTDEFSPPGVDAVIRDRDVAACWEDNAEVWTRHVRAGYDTFRRLYENPAFFAFVGDLSGRVVLDAGCGEGMNTRLWAARGARMVGVDLSPRLVAAAKAEEARVPLGIRYEVASLSDLALFPDGTFDACVSTMVLMECADYEGALEEIHRVLKRQGMFAFSIGHPCFTYDIRRWEHDENGECVGLGLGNYFDTGAFEEQWRFGAAPREDQERTKPFTVVSFRRTLAEVLNPLSEAGFRLQGLLEPQPTEEACNQDPRLRCYRIAPHILCVKASKV